MLRPAQHDKLIIHCGSGVTACHTILALDYAGLTQFRILYVRDLGVSGAEEKERNCERSLIVSQIVLIRQILKIKKISKIAKSEEVYKKTLKIFSIFYIFQRISSFFLFLINEGLE